MHFTKMQANLQKFVDDPSVAFWVQLDLKKDDWIALAGYYEVSIKKGC